jgi:hypothetical protein
MSNSLGDFDTSTVVYGKFTTFRPSTGAAYTLGGTPALSVYKDNSTTQSTTGVTLTADFDSVTGLNHFAIDTSADGTFYAAGSFFDIVITTGTVDSVSVVGTVVARFTLRKNSALKPTTAGRTLDVSAGGEAGVDWANIGSPTTTVNLSGTTVKTATDVETDTADIQTRLPAALVGGRIDANMGAISSDATAADNAEAFFDGTGYAGTNNVIPTVTSVTNGVTVSTNNDKTGYTLSAAGIQAIWDALTSALTTVGSIGKLLVDNINATISSRLASASYTAPLDAAGTRNALGLASANLDTQLDALPTAAENADAVWDEALAGHLGAGSTGEALNAAGAAGDPWTTSLPGAYGAGSAGYIIGTNLNATVSSRASQTALDTLDDFVDTEVAAIKAKTDQLTFTTANRVDSQVYGMQTDVITASAIATDAIGSNELAASAIAEIQSGLSNLSQADIRTALGMASANLDTQLAAIDTETDKIASIKTKTDSLTFTVAGQVDSNIQYVNDVQVTGNGQTGSEWGP